MVVQPGDIIMWRGQHDLPVFIVHVSSCGVICELSCTYIYGEGGLFGPHSFYEKDMRELHARCT